MKTKYAKFAIKFKGMYRIGAVNCDENHAICEKEGVTDSLPMFRIYPAFPIPVQDFKGDRFDLDKAKNGASKYISSKIEDLNTNTLGPFVKEDPAKPKVLLFTDKKSTPLIFRALKDHFHVSSQYF